ncbi:MAG: hypothetical protein B6U77_00775 [Candidatus Hecatellales archaeon ex4484_218]|nr:MAG: hypothetical protein B6U77_00775 [Candidatus Hecatellales archaeon ex4484_218]
MFKEVTQKILDLLQADATLNQTVKKWYFGFPVEAFAYPFIAVRWVGGPVTVMTGSKERYEINFEIGVVCSSQKEDEAEKQVMDLVEKIDEILDNNPTLDGLVDDSHISEIRSETGLTEKGSILVGALIMLTTFKTKI